MGVWGCGGRVEEEEVVITLIYRTAEELIFFSFFLLTRFITGIVISHLNGSECFLLPLNKLAGPKRF